jgi:polysaccharide deacetylase family protein (PEP-CTERM system associated)
VEDWFQVENLREQIPLSTWEQQQYRVERNTENILDILSQCKVKATFFVLGWIAKRSKRLIQAIHAEGHEIASHGHKHIINPQLDNKQILEDLILSKRLLEDIVGIEIIGYRAPSFSVNDNIIEIIAKAGYLYDSSLNTFSLHDRYGSLQLYDYDKPFDFIKTHYGTIMEIPVSNIKFNKYFIPWSGGGYFRIIPFPVFCWGVNVILEKVGIYTMYLHSWEIDNEQPRLKNLRLQHRLRHYINLKNTRDNLYSFLNKFSNYNFITCKEFFYRNNAAGI